MANSNFRVKHGLEVSGNVGIGTTNPIEALDVRGTVHINKTATWHDPHLELFVENNTDDVFVSATGDGFYPSLDFYSVSSTQGGGSSGSKLFTAFTGEQLSNGAYKTGIKLRDNNVLVFGTSSNSFIQYSNNTNALELKTLDAKPITVDTNDTERLRITSDGNIGIGSTQPTAKLDVNGGLNVSGIVSLSATNMSTGISTITGPATIHIDPTAIGDDTGSVRIKGDLYVDGTNFVVDSETITLADHVVGIASTATTDALTDGAGIGIGSDKTFTYDNTNTSLKSSENLNLASGKTYKIDGSDVLSGTTLGSGVTGSSLTSVGTLGSLTVSGDASFTGTGSSVTFSGNASLTGLGKSFSVGIGTQQMFLTVEGGGNGGLGFISHEKELFLSVVDGVKITNFAGTVTSAQFVPGAEVNLYHNTSKKLETTSSGVTVTGSLTADAVKLGDSERVELGNSADLALSHTGTNGYIDNDKGHLYIRNNVDGDDGSNIYIKPHDNEDGIIIHDDGGVELYYDNSKKLETTGGGVKVTGILTATSIDAAVSYASSAGIATNVTVITSSSNTHFKVPFVNHSGSTDGNYGLLHDSETSSFTYNPNQNQLQLGGLHAYGVDATSRITLPDGAEFRIGGTTTLAAPAGGDVKVFYDGTANDLEIELETDANGIAITDNGTYKHKITRTSVGINTGTPREEMDVIGDIGVQASGASNRFSIQHNSAQNSLDFVFI